jgi:hypothetical protein
MATINRLATSVPWIYLVKSRGHLTANPPSTEFLYPLYALQVTRTLLLRTTK